MMPYIRNLHVHEFSEILSNAHCPVTLQIQFKAQFYHSQPDDIKDTGLDQKNSSWDKNKSDEFIKNIDQALLENINQTIIYHQSVNNVTQNDLDLIIENINKAILTSADKS